MPGSLVLLLNIDMTMKARSFNGFPGSTHFIDLQGAAPQQLFNPDGSERGADDDVFDEVLEELGLQRDAGGGGVIGPVVAPAAQAAEPAAEPELPLIDAAAKIGFLSLANRVTPGEFKGHKYLDLREWYCNFTTNFFLNKVFIITY